MSHLKRTLIEAVIILILFIMLGITMYCRGRKAGRAGQEGKDRRENVERAREKGDTDAIDREWER